MLTNGKICILIPTFPRYKVLAEFTEKMLDKYWRQHPRIYFSGCENSEDKNWLTTQRSPSSWMHETYDAVKMLRDMGFLRCYLILDDHPPVRKCHSKHLLRSLNFLKNWMQPILGYSVGGRTESNVTERDLEMSSLILRMLLWISNTNFLCIRDCGILSVFLKFYGL